jgi:hypothetical protein
MKKIALPLLALFFLFSCVSTKEEEPPVFNYEVSSESASGLADVSIEAEWKFSSFLDPTEGISGFDLTVKNNTDKIIKVVWEESSLTYLGQTYLPFINGQKYIDASRPMTSSVIPARGKITTSLFSSGQPYFSSGRYGGWEMRPIPSVDIAIALSVVSGDLKDYYTIKVTRQWITPAE